MEKTIQLPFPLDGININNFRGIEDCSIKNLGRLNLLVGRNNVGKTSILEAIYLGYSLFENGLLYNFIKRGEKYPVCIDYFFYKKPEVVTLDLISLNNSLNVKLEKTANIDQDIYDTFEKEFQEGKYFELIMKHITNNTFSHAKVIFGISSKLNISQRINTGNMSLYDAVLNVSILDSKFNLDKLLGGYSNIVKNNAIKELIDVLEPIFKINDVRIIKDDSNVILYVELKDKYIPISSCGEGLKWSLLLSSKILSINKGIILIDDFENFHHPASLRNAIKAVINSVKNKNIQIFISTHSLECIDAFLEESVKDNTDMKLIYLNKIDDKIVSNTYTLNDALESRELVGTDLRGI